MVLPALALATAAQAEPKPKPELPSSVRIAKPEAQGPVRPAPVAALGRAFEKLRAEYAARNPDVALDAHWTRAEDLTLGTHGNAALLRWRAALEGLRSEIARMSPGAGTRLEAARLASLDDWCAAEQLLLDAQALPTHDPSSYVQRAARVLASARAVRWLPDEARDALRLRLLDGLPAYLRDARTSLLAPVPEWIDAGLLELDALEALVMETEALRAPGAAPKESPRAALEAFRRWLLEQRPRAGGRPTRLEPEEWTRLVGFVTGGASESRELKARCLRELARLEPAAGDEPAQRELPLAPDELARRVTGSAARALAFGQAARVVRHRSGPDDLVVVAEESGSEVTAGARVNARAGAPLELVVALPGRVWPVERADTRLAALQGRELGTLGVRHGFTGEALYERMARAQRDPLRALLHRPTQRTALGLYALDWIPRVGWVPNAFVEDPLLVRAFGLQIRYEIARLLAALEQHAEGVSSGEAALAFQRRTGVDAATARAEALAAERDPLHGLGYVGMLELRGLEERLAAIIGEPRRGLGLTLLLATRHPDLRPSDMREEADRVLRLRVGSGR